MDINYAVLMPPPKRSARKLQLAVLGGVGAVALTAIVVAVVMLRAYSPDAAALGSPPSTLQPAPAPQPIAAAPAPALATQLAVQPPVVTGEDKGAAKKPKRAVRGGRRANKAVAAKATAGGTKPTVKKRGDDDLKRLLGI